MDLNEGFVPTASAYKFASQCFPNFESSYFDNAYGQGALISEFNDPTRAVSSSRGERSKQVFFSLFVQSRELRELRELGIAFVRQRGVTRARARARGKGVAAKCDRLIAPTSTSALCLAAPLRAKHA